MSQSPARSRRKFPKFAITACAAFALALSAGALCVPIHAEAANNSNANLVVKTDRGSVKGFIKNGAVEFLGIPYAAPPVGNLRWRPPVKHTPWNNIIQATVYGPNCAEVETLGVFAGPANTNEDCLYLNIFTPNLNAGNKQKLPVMVWDYGGGDVDGESNDYDGSKLAVQGHTVVVTFNYRLNLFGFFAHPAIDNEGHLFGNYGLLDYQFALKWVQDNIGNFGGDKNNVTILGQSAGARNTGSQVLSPLAKGLFEHAIYESGALPSLSPVATAEQKGIAFAVAAGCGSGTDAATAKCLRNLTAAQVESLAGTQSAGSPYLAGIIGDGQILPTNAVQAYESGEFNHVPIIMGNVEDEGNFALAQVEYFENPRTPLTEAQFEAYLNSTYAPPAYPAGTAAKVLAQYPLAAYPSPQLQWAAQETAANYSCQTHFIAQILAKQIPLYTYEFRDETAPFYFPKMPGFVPLAYHTSDIQYYWPLYHGGPQGIAHPLNVKQQNLSDQLVGAWTNFAYTGNPNGNGNSPWPQYKKTNGLFLAEQLGGLSTLTDSQFYNEHDCSFWDKVLGYQY
ncbi:MAG TPA: carboxylesterase family protein [Methylovirgula sp.]|nr:carboxylesterase family protein [Methylovirgula sp.]